MIITNFFKYLLIFLIFFMILIKIELFYLLLECIMYIVNIIYILNLNNMMKGKV